MIDLEYFYTRVSLNNETYIFYILQSKFQRHDNKKVRLFVYHAFSLLWFARKWENTELSERRMSVGPWQVFDAHWYKCLSLDSLKNSKHRESLDPMEYISSFLRIPNFYQNSQFVLPCVQIMQIARIGVPWEAEVLWSEFHPEHPPYIWKSMRKSWTKCFVNKLCLGTPRFSDLNFIPAGIIYSHLSVHEENHVHFKVHEGNYVHGENLKDFFSSRKHFCEVLWLEFHPCRCPLLAFPWYYLEETLTSDHLEVYKTSCSYIWKSTRNT